MYLVFIYCVYWKLSFVVNSIQKRLVRLEGRSKRSRRSKGRRRMRGETVTTISWCGRRDINQFDLVTDFHSVVKHTHRPTSFLLKFSEKAALGRWVRQYKHCHAIEHTLIHSYTHTLIHSYTHTLIHSYTHTLIHSYTHTHTLTHSHTHTHTLTHSHTHTLTHSHTHTLTHTHSYTHTLIHSYTHTLIQYHEVKPSTIWQDLVQQEYKSNNYCVLHFELFKIRTFSMNNKSTKHCKTLIFNKMML